MSEDARPAGPRLGTFAGVFTRERARAEARGLQRRAVAGDAKLADLAADAETPPEPEADRASP